MKFEHRRATLAPALRRHARLPYLAAVLAMTGAHPAVAQSTPASDELRAEIQQLRAEQARIDELQRQTDAKIRALEARLGANPSDGKTPAPQAATAPAAVAAAADKPRLNVTGDLRLRYQGDYSDEDGTDRSSSQVRGRIGATYAVNDRVTVGARLSTGDPDDPNSTDVQLSNFNDDFDVGFDLAYAQFNFGDLELYGGKIPQPFTRTDLVWDGDVNPQGASAVYKHALAEGAAFRANGLFFVIDEQAAGPESTMHGMQLGYDSAGFGDWKYDVSAAYYDYRLGSVAGADSGDFRSNLRNPDGSYRSDFDLVDLIVGATWTGVSERWPLRILGDYVKNFGAETSADTAYGLDLALGRVSQQSDWRVTYGYSVAETDAVLAAFSHDNIGIATNYRLHALTFDYVLLPKTLLTAIWYHYRPDNAVDAGSNAPGDWLDRFRLAVVTSF